MFPYRFAFLPRRKKEKQKEPDIKNISSFKEFILSKYMLKYYKIMFYSI